MYKPISKPLTAIATIMLLSGCGANHNSIFRTHTPYLTKSNNVNVALVDAKQRAIISQKIKDAKGLDGQRTIVCSEPSPDVFSVLASSFGASGSVGDGKTNIGAAIKAITSESGGSFGLRTQTITALRDMMFYLCQYHMSGAVDDADVRAAMHRQGKLLTAILAIEQLTGAPNPAQVTVKADGKDINITIPASSERGPGEEQEGDIENNDGGDSPKPPASSPAPATSLAPSPAPAPTSASSATYMRHHYSEPEARVINLAHMAYEDEADYGANMGHNWAMSGNGYLIRTNVGGAGQQQEVEGQQAQASAQTDDNQAAADQTAGQSEVAQETTPATGGEQPDTKPDQKAGGDCCQLSDATVAAVKSIVQTVFYDDEVENLCLTKLLQENAITGFSKVLCEERLIIGAFKGANSIQDPTAQAALTKRLESTFVSKEAQMRAEEALVKVDGLQVTAAAHILLNPPSKLSSSLIASISKQLGDVPRGQWARVLGGAANDDKAKVVLRMVLPMLDRTPDALGRWDAVINAFQK